MENTYTISDLRNWSKVKQETETKITLGVIGNPVSHSLSPQMHNAALQELNLPQRYARFEIGEADFTDAVDLMKQHQFIGINVTIPHKELALSSASEVSSTARNANSVNTLLFESNKILGYSTDGAGFVNAIRQEFSMDIRDLRVLVLGAGGGAGRAIAVQCALERCERLVLANRSPEKLEALQLQLKEHFHSDKLAGPSDALRTIPLEEKAIENEISNVDLIVNATPLGMKRTDPSPLPRALLSAYHLVYDTVYSPGKTQLLEDAAAAGARTANGLSMLVHQGVLSFELWFGILPNAITMQQAITPATGI